MRNAILVSILTGVLVTGAASVYAAGEPVSGTYKSSSGHFDEGTATTTWAADFLSPGNILYGRSTSGGVFTNDWTVQCPTVVAVTPLFFGAFAGSGNFSFMITYSGGYVTLGPGNPWDGGAAPYTGLITNYYEIRTVQLASNVVTGAVSDHAIEATIQGYSESCVAWAIGNGALRGGTPPGLPKPFLYPTLQSVKGAGYPDFPNAACALSPNGPGHWDDIRDLTLTVKGCTVATQPSTWGNVKSMYRN